MRGKLVGRQTVGGSILSSGAVGVATIALNLLTLPLIFSSIGTAPYGVWLLLTAVATFIYQADIGIGSAVLYRVAAAKTQEDRNNIASSSLAWMLAVSVLAIPVYWFASSLIVEGSHLSVLTTDQLRVLPIFGCILVGSIWTRLFSALLPALGLWSLERGFQMIALGLRLLGTLYVVIFNQSIMLVALVETAALLLPGILAVVYVKRKRLVRFGVASCSIAEIRRLLSYSVKAFTVSLASNAVLQSGPVLVGIVGSPSDVSYYTAATRVYGGAKQVISWMVDPFVPVLSRLRSKGEAVGIHILSLCTSTVLLGFLLSGSLLLSCDVLVSIWLGGGRTAVAVAEILQVLLLGLALNASHLPANALGNALGRPGAFLWLYVLWALSGIALSIWWGGSAGPVGVAAGMTAPLLFLQPLYLLRMKSVLNLPLLRWGAQAGGPALLFTTISLCLAAVPLLAIPSDAIGKATSTIVFGVAFMALIVCCRRLIGLRAIRDLISLGA